MHFYPIKDTIVQVDFSDNNIVFDKKTGKYTHIDLGEIVIAHPFFSLDNCLRQMHKHYDLTEQDERFMKIKNSLFKNYNFVYGESKVAEAFALTQIFWYVNDALGQYRLIGACDREAIISFQSGKLSRTLRTLLDVLN